MDKRAKLLVAQIQIENLIRLSGSFDYNKFFEYNLYPVRHEIERQLKLLDKNYLSDYN